MARLRLRAGRVGAATASRDAGPHEVARADRRRSRRVRRAQATAIVLALGLGLIPLEPHMVERWFSTALYPAMQRVVTPLLNRIGFAVFDVLLVATAAWLVLLVVRAMRVARRVSRRAGLVALLWNVAATAAAVYLAFLLLWGLNYRRVPMVERLVQQGAPSSEAVLDLGLEAAARLNALHAPAHQRGWDGQEWRDEQMHRAFVSVQQTLSEARPARPGRLKATLLGPYFRWTGVDGMVNPFAFEVLANPDLLPFERPFVAAHEWAHLAGYADEAEASFVGWLTCMRGDVASQYSGWLFLYWQVAGEAGFDRERLAHALDDGPRADIEAVSARLRRSQWPLLRRASWVAYDQYLKANRVEEGIRSYGAVVTLILRARFDDGWTPARRPEGPSPR